MSQHDGIFDTPIIEPKRCAECMGIEPNHWVGCRSQYQTRPPRLFKVANSVLPNIATNNAERITELETENATLRTRLRAAEEALDFIARLSKPYNRWERSED